MAGGLRLGWVSYHCDIQPVLFSVKEWTCLCLLEMKGMVEWVRGNIKMGWYGGGGGGAWGLPLFAGPCPHSLRGWESEIQQLAECLPRHPVWVSVWMSSSPVMKATISDEDHPNNLILTLLPL